MVSAWRACPPAYRSRRARSTKACWCSWAECIKRVPTGTNGRRRSRDRRPAPALSGSNLPGPDGLSPTSMGASDPVRLAQAGDQDAFHALYREHVGRQFAVCLRLTGDRGRGGAAGGGAGRVGVARGGRVRPRGDRHDAGNRGGAIESPVVSRAAIAAESARAMNEDELLKRARRLPATIEPSRDLWPGIAARLARRPGSPPVRLWLALAASVVALVGGWLALRPSGGAWSVATLAGAPTRGTRRLGPPGALQVGDELATDGASRARVAVGTIGALDVETNTRLPPPATTATNQRLAPDPGTISPPG